MKLARLPSGKPEIFHTIQGEGRNAGRPSVFVRASLCNLTCRWCDTDYTWNWEGTSYRHDRDGEPGYEKYRKEEQIVDLKAEAIAEVVASCDCRHLVLTGGEPLIQHRDWLELIDALKARDSGFTFEVETNGTIPPSTGFAAAIDQFNVSPKLANSGVDLADRRKPEALRFFAALENADFKFVVDAEDDLAEVIALIEEFDIAPDRVFLMPQGTSAKALADKAEWLSRICLEKGFRYSDRLQVRLWGDRRGV